MSADPAAVRTGPRAPQHTGALVALAGADRRYGALLARAGADALAPAGLFDDGLSAAERTPGEHRWLLTPVGKVARALAAAGVDQDREPVVLLLTGALDPVHPGHLAALEAARAHLTRAGHHVVGGYLAPDHDAYVAGKHPGAAAAPARVAQARAACAGSDWVEVDPWPALGAGTALNFTTVMDRLAGYLVQHVGPVRVVAVYGSDNAGFAAVLGRDGVCVGRPGLPGAAEAAVTSAVACSSTLVRAGRAAAAGTSPAAGPGSAGEVPPAYLVRDDLAASLPPRYVGRVDPAGFTAALTALLGPAAPGPVRLLPLTSAAPGPVPGAEAVLSLDAHARGARRLRLSRVFDVAGAQDRPLAVRPSPGAPDLDAQLAGCPGRVALHDDDVATGTTLTAARALLRERGIEVVAELVNERAYTGAVADVVDARDFLLGARDGGLVVALPGGGLARAPYAAPYVNLTTRASIPPDRAAALSEALWRLNATALAGSGLTVADADPATGALLAYLGFGPGLPLAQVAAWHVHRLEQLPCTPAGGPR